MASTKKEPRDQQSAQIVHLRVGPKLDFPGKPTLPQFPAGGESSR
jgi:hypothetical protein